MVKDPSANAGRHKRHGFDPWVRKIPWRRAWQPAPVFLPGESHGQRNLVSYSLRSHKESDNVKQMSILTQSTYIKIKNILHAVQNLIMSKVK